METAIAKAEALIEAHHYIRRFSGRIVVVKIGGSIMDQPGLLRQMIKDVCFLDAVGIHPVLVHGGGKAITNAMAEAGLEAQFVQGRRYTDERTLAIAEHVLVNDINKFIVDSITKAGHKAMGLHSLGSCAVFGKRLFLQTEDQRQLDVGLVGEVQAVNGELVSALAEAGVVSVIAPIARDHAGSKLNINADSVAGEVAGTLKAAKLVLISDTHGIRTGETDDTLASTLKRTEIEQLVAAGTIGSGMLPKVEAAISALNQGVEKVHIIDGRIAHSLLLEIFSKQGIGTEITLN